MSELARVHLSKSAPDVYKALAAFSKTVGGVADEAGIDARLKELVQIHVSQLNGCAFCVRVHVERATKAGVTADVIAQLPVWRESGVFSDREQAGLELAEASRSSPRTASPTMSTTGWAASSARRSTSR